MGEGAAQYRDLLGALYRENPSVRHGLEQMGVRKRAPAWPVGGASSPLTVCDSRGEIFKLQARGRGAGRVRSRVSIVVPLLFLAGLIALAVVVGPPIVRFVLRNWRVVLVCIGTACVGASISLLLGRIGFQPLRKLRPPCANTEEPLKELESLAERTARRLRTAYKIEVSLLVTVFTGFAVIVGWTMMLVSQNRVAYACAFGSGGVAMLILSKWKWQPFDRMAEARRLADLADVLATALRMRMRTIQEIKDPAARSKAQWEAVRDYVELS